MNKTPEEVREECAKIAEDLESRWRASAAEQMAIYDRAWIGDHENLKSANTINAAANGLAAVAMIIRNLSLTRD